MPIDLRSDTVTQPTPAMRRAMAEAEVGDDVLDGDPTVRRLEARVAELLGMERALFFPSGTMANQTGVWVLSQPGTEVLVDAGAHILHYEQAGAAALSGVQLRPVQGTGTVMDAEALERSIRPRSPSTPRATLVCFENTHNGAGGRVMPPEDLRTLREVARRHHLHIHLDGARLWNASVALNVSLAELASGVDTVMVSFTKGLGAPVGAALAGGKALIEDAWVVRKRLGGGMRQSGILAAAALHALTAHLSRLAEDHARARRFAESIDGAGGARVVPPDTNIVMIDLPPDFASTDLVRAAGETGVLISPWSANRVRAVLHLDIDDRMIERASDVVAKLLDRGV